VRVSHRADDGKPITGMGHVQVREKSAKIFCRDTAERFAYI
jgi:hypothetical protein